MRVLLVLFLFGAPLFSASKVQLGVDLFFESSYLNELHHKRVALVTNQTGVDSRFRSTASLLMECQEQYEVVAFFSPEHGFLGTTHAGNKVLEGKKESSIPCHSLYGNHRRPTKEMLKGIDVIIYDIQEIGSRSYTYATTLYYVMEEAAKAHIQVIVLDRPNPLGGVMVDGPMLRAEERSFVGYLNVPYCHGMTIGELAQFFNQEYGIRCALTVVPMKGWKREMSFQETALPWIPTSPQIPEPDTPFYYPMTGILGELELVNIGVGYTLPFKIFGAPWIDADQMAQVLNRQKLPGIRFLPFHFKPFFGSYKNEECHGVRLIVTEMTAVKPVTTGYLIIGLLKSLYPREVTSRLKKISASKKKMFFQINGTPRVWEVLTKERYAGWKMAAINSEEREEFMKRRQPYLLY